MVELILCRFGEAGLDSISKDISGLIWVLANSVLFRLKLLMFRFVPTNESVSILHTTPLIGP